MIYEINLILLNIFTNRYLCLKMETTQIINDSSLFFLRILVYKLSHIHTNIRSIVDWSNGVVKTIMVHNNRQGTE